MTAEHDKQGATHGEANATAKDALDLTYTPHHDATPEDEIRVLAAVYAFILKRHERKETTAEVGSDARTEGRCGGGAPEKHPAKDDSA